MDFIYTIIDKCEPGDGQVVTWTAGATSTCDYIIGTGNGATCTTAFTRTTDTFGTYTCAAQAMTVVVSPGQPGLLTATWSGTGIDISEIPRLGNDGSVAGDHTIVLTPLSPKSTAHTMEDHTITLTIKDPCALDTNNAYTGAYNDVTYV